MLPAILALAQLAPAITGLLTHDKHASRAAAVVAETAKVITGAPTEDAALVALRADPAKLVEYQNAMNAHAATIYAEAAETVRTEMRGESPLQRNWRPITMLVFVGLIVARWLGLTAPGITPDVELAVMGLIKVGLGGYVVGRSAEKVVKSLPAGLFRGSQ